MTKYRIDRIDRIITSAYVGPLAKRHCAAPRANADVDGDDVTECTGCVQTEPLHTTHSTHGSMCRIWTERSTATAPMITTICRKQTMNNQRHLRLHLEQ